MTPLETKEKMLLDIDGMTCASCVSRVEGALAGVEGVEKAEVNLASRRATVEGENLTEDELAKAVHEAGYSMDRFDPRSGEEEQVDKREQKALREKRQIQAKFIFAAVVGAVLLGMAFIWSPFSSRTDMWVMFALATPVQFWAGSQFYKGAWQIGKHGTADMNTLIAVGTSAAYFYSVVATVAPRIFEKCWCGAGRLLRHRRGDHRTYLAWSLAGGACKGWNDPSDQETDGLEGEDRQGCA